MSASRSRNQRLALPVDAHTAPRPPEARDEDEIERDHEEDEPEPGALDLPPIVEDPEDEPEESYEDLLETLEDNDDPLDNETASHLDIGVELSLDDSAPGGDEPTGEEESLDVGALDEGIVDDRAVSWLVELAHDADSFEEDEIDGDEDAHGDDGGSEGTGEDPADDVDEREFPALDADDDSIYEGEDLLAELPGFADDGSPTWDALPWVVVEGAGAAVACNTVVVANGYVIAGGSGVEATRDRGAAANAEPARPAAATAPRVGSKARRADKSAADRGIVLLIEPGAQAAQRAGVETSASSIAMADGAIFIATRRGNLLRSLDVLRSASALGTWGSGAAPVTLATTPGRLWVLSSGSLWSPAAGARSEAPSAADAAAAPPRHDGAAVTSRAAVAPSPGPAVLDGVLQIAASAGVIVALVGGPAEPHLERLRSDDEHSPSIPLSGAALRAAQADDHKLAATADGSVIALSGAGVICVSRDGGETFRTLDGLSPIVALAFGGEHRGAPLLALAAREQDQRVQLLYVPASAAPTVIAEIETTPGGGSDEGQVQLGGAALAWDPAREVAWIACQAGLIALTRERKH